MEPFYKDEMATIYNFNALEVLRLLRDESAQMCMTSPPYWGLRNYAGGSDLIWGGEENCEHIWVEETQGLQHENRNNLRGTQEEAQGKTGTAFIQKYDRMPSGTCVLCGAWQGQLGLEPTPELYVEHLLMIFHELKRVLRKDGSFYLNIGDTYVSGKGSCFNPGGGPRSWQSRVDRRGNYPIGRDAPNRMCKTIPPKCMACIPERVLFGMLEDGWILRNKNIWHKPNSMPGSQKDRFSCSWEFLYFFVKNNDTILWRNRETGVWRDTRPTKEENYPLGGMYQNIETGKFSWTNPPEQDKWVKYQPLWTGFDYYFDLDAVRLPHKTQSLERYQRQVNFGDKTPASKYSGASPYPEGVQPIYREGRNLCPDWFKEMFPQDQDYKGKFDNLFGHGPQPQSFNLRVRDVKRGKRGVSALTGELRASEKEIEEYEYPEKHHGSSMSNQVSLHGDRFDKAAKRSIPMKPPHHAERFRESDFGAEATGETAGFHPRGKNPGDYWDITTQPSSICVCPKCEAVFPRYTKVCPTCKVEGVVGHFAPYPVALCEIPIMASTRVGDIVLDPLAGGGNTGVAAKKLGRKCILIDCVREYCIMARHKLSRLEYQPELMTGVKSTELLKGDSDGITMHE